jgi:hypothetical protein
MFQDTTPPTVVPLTGRAAPKIPVKAFAWINTAPYTRSQTRSSIQVPGCIRNTSIRKMAWNIPAMLPWHCDNIPGHPASHRGDTEVTQPSKRGEGEHHRITSVTIAACRYLLAPPTIITKSGQPLRRPPQKASRAIETMALRPPRPAPCRPLSSLSYAWAPLVRIVPYTDCRPRPMSTTSTTRTTMTATTTTTSAALTD